ncbi:preprotein translocase subunit SecG [Candidatus Curtissbacteria bacterium]|nr:preprotein translocase subunit SecG [Candidatus Curtissbacteria bacterium]
MKTFLLILQLIVSSALVVVVLLQAKGSGLSGVFGGESSFYRSKRGVEKMLIYATIGLGFLFFVLSITQVLISK